MDDLRPTASLTEARAAQLLDRAAKLDVEGGPLVSVDELRAVALEAGISAEAFERAFAEINAQESASRAASTIDVLEVMMPAGFLASILGGFVVATGPSEPERVQLPKGA